MAPKGPHGERESRQRRKRAHEDRSDSDSSGLDDDLEEELGNEQEIVTEQDVQSDDRKKIQDGWAQVMKDLNKEELTNSAEAQKEFFKTHKAFLGPPPTWAMDEVPSQNRNVLVRLAIDGRPELPHLVKTLVECHPELLQDAGMSDQRAFDFAINAKVEWFIKAVIESSIKDEELEKALGAIKASDGQAGSKSNCIHKLIATDIDPLLMKRLIERASPSGDLLTAHDDTGLTPLHLAVDYRKCIKGRSRVVRALLRQGDGALDKRTPPPESYSAYRYHMHTRKQYEPKKPAKAAADQVEHKAEKKEPERRREDEKPMPGAEKDEAPLQGPVMPLKEQKTRKDEEKEREKEREKGRETAARSSGLQRAPTLTNMGQQHIDGNAVNNRDNNGAGGHTARHMHTQANTGRPLLVSEPLVSKPTGTTRAGAGASPTPTLPPTSPNGNLTTTPARPPLASKGSNPKRSQRPTKGRADEIAKTLKLYYFRSIFEFQPGDKHHVQRNHASAEEFLYGDNKECKAICFQFPPVLRKEPETIDFVTFKESYKGFAFDPMLLYVDFGKFRLDSTVDSRDTRAVKKALERRLEEGPGRRDLVQFFDWLSHKGVENIIKVSVDDEDEVLHCDEAIIASLAKFDIEILDWRKADLCPRAIRKACNGSRNLRELHLCWSGNNAILRSWSEPDGLARLLELEQIHIYEIKPCLDSPHRTKANIVDFERRLNQNLKEKRKAQWENDNPDKEYVDEEEDINVEIHRYDKLYDPGHAHGVQNPLGQGVHRPQSGNKIDEHQWLDIMDTFAEAVRRVQEVKLNNFPQDYLTHPSLQRELARDVTVALIDDGVDFMHPAISKKLMPGRSFDSGFGFHELGSPAPFHGSTTGHGTFMAYMIQRVCPSVKIFVYKIDVLPKDKDGDAVTFTAKSAADAVVDAVKRGFDIISLSWSVQKNDSLEKTLNNMADLQRLKGSLLKAGQDEQDSQGKKIGKETLLFCSAPDTGESSVTDSHYPFNCEGVSKIFRIGAAQVTGKAYPWVGTQVDYILPGEKVGMKTTDMVRPIEDKVLRTGSSVATALAAGLAAMVIHCVRLGAVYNHYQRNQTGVSEQSVRAIKTYKGMKAAFETISKRDRRLGVDSFFKNRGTELGTSAPQGDKEKEKWREEKWSNVAEMARRLVTDELEKEFAAKA